MSNTKQRLNDLLKYVRRLGQLNQEPVFAVADYGRFCLQEHELVDRIGVQFNVVDNEGLPVWLKIERLKRTSPPTVPESIADWIRVSNDPEVPVHVNETLIKTLPELEAKQLLESGEVKAEDVQASMQETQRRLVLKDVTLQLDSFPQTKQQLEEYINTSWYKWSKKEKTKRNTIKIYDALFTLQQNMEAQGDEQPLELIWGVGVSRWLLNEHKVDFPLLEKSVEIEIDNHDGSIAIRPRNTEHNLVIAPYFALGNSGIDALIRYEKKHFSELTDDIEFSPFAPESYEPVLRHAATQLSVSGEFWPDISPDISNRQPPDITSDLQVSDSWIIYARPRGSTPYVQDIERFQSELEQTRPEDIPAPAKRMVAELSDSKIAFSNTKTTATMRDVTAEIGPDESELYFPKPYNDAQVKIIDRLQENDGVVVQGPPGTGKTHTIANIISHYLSTGKTVLVTSNGESALSALRNQIPQEVRDLTISLLTNERQGFKQLETAVQLLATIASQTNLTELHEQAVQCDEKVKQIRVEINEIDQEVLQLGLKQLQHIDDDILADDTNLTAMELAQSIVNVSQQYDWFPDELGTGSEFNPLFTDADISALRSARKKIGKYIDQLDLELPSLGDLPNASAISALHSDLVTVERLSSLAKTEKLPVLKRNLDNALGRVAAVSPRLRDTLNSVKALQVHPWLLNLFHHWSSKGLGHESANLFESMLPTVRDFLERRVTFIQNPVQVPDPDVRRASLIEAVTRLSKDERPFGLLSIGRGEIKSLLNEIGINGEKPNSARKWALVLDYLNFQDEGRRLIIKLNSVGQEYNLPKLAYTFGDTFKNLKDFEEQINSAKTLAIDTWPDIAKELQQLFPDDLRVDNILTDDNEANRVLAAIANHTSRIDLTAQQKRLANLQKFAAKYKGETAQRLKEIVKKNIGNANYELHQIIEQWQDVIQEFTHLYNLQSAFQTLRETTTKIKDCGAKNWAKQLLTEPVLADRDELIPQDWRAAWQWKRQYAYVSELDQRKHLKKLSRRRTKLETELASVFTNLVRLKTNIGLHGNLTERVHGALVRFVSAISKLGAGTGKKRAPRFRREALQAMQDCYDGVPCWIMPTWRISESLPSKFSSFDLVIIDEASQSDIAALPAILRAKKLLVVGDDKQVSPTAAFISEEKIHQLKQNYLTSQPFADLLIPGVSLYDLASAVYPTQRIMLTEHFRCVEPIIRFSMQFYSDALIPLRLPKHSERIDPPLVDVYVHNGKRDESRGINEAEVYAIVDEIKQVVNNPALKGRSIGVISLIGSEQAQMIQEALLAELGEDTYQKYDIGCGDSATFQGKEKDIIFLSLVVGPGQGAALNKREFEQRFNVALSRARDRMYLYRSVKDSDLKHGNDLRLRVIRHFSNPMPARELADKPLALCHTEFERTLYMQLTQMGYAVTPQVTVGPYTIDMVVEGDKDQRLAIELDGDEQQTAQQWTRKLENQRILERVGWTFWRCWGSSYVIDPQLSLDDLVATLNALGIKPIGTKGEPQIFTEHREFSCPVQDSILHLQYQETDDNNTGSLL